MNQWMAVTSNVASRLIPWGRRSLVRRASLIGSCALAVDVACRAQVVELSVIWRPRNGPELVWTNVTLAPETCASFVQFEARYRLLSSDDLRGWRQVDYYTVSPGPETQVH